MLGIEEIAYYIPEKRVSNYNRKEKFGINDEFIRNRIGVEEIAVKSDLENTSDMCINAYKKLKDKIAVNDNDIDVVIVVTQNPDFNIPQTSAILHGKLGFKEDCVAFDVSLGCSGFVYGLSVITAFMQVYKFKKGLLFTADPYSKIVDPADKNTSLLFGDAATVSLISENPVFSAQDFVFGTNGSCYKDLLCENNTLYMNGRGIANFAIKVVPKDILVLLARNGLTIVDIDKYLIHQGSRFIVDSLSKKLGLDESKVIYDISSYGNTVSSSIPILIEKIMKDKSVKLALGSGFGVGLSWANVLLKRIR